ncbi:Rho termination factor N-terminal domain-containing protein [Thermovibrio sp.]
MKRQELLSLTKRELYEIAKKLKIKGRGRMRKKELLEAIEKELSLIELSCQEEPITSQLRREEALPEEGKEQELPKIENEFLGAIPVNPKLVYTYWNVESTKGNGRLELIGDRGILEEAEVDLNWKKYYFNLKEETERVKARLKVNGKTLESIELSAPTQKIHLKGESLILEREVKELFKVRESEIKYRR